MSRDFDKIAKSNGSGWDHEDVVRALCEEIGKLRQRIRALEAVSHAPQFLTPQPPPSEER